MCLAKSHLSQSFSPPLYFTTSTSWLETASPPLCFPPSRALPFVQPTAVLQSPRGCTFFTDFLLPCSIAANVLGTCCVLPPCIVVSAVTSNHPSHPSPHFLLFLDPVGAWSTPRTLRRIPKHPATMVLRVCSHRSTLILQATTWYSSIP